MKTKLKPWPMSLLAALLVSSSSWAGDVIRPEVSYQPLDLQAAFGSERVPQKSSVDVRWQYLGKAWFDGPEQPAAGSKIEAETAKRVPADDLKVQVKPGELRQWVAVNLQTGDEYLVELPVETAKGVRQLAAQAGYESGYEGDAVAEADESPTADLGKGLSNGSDTRTRRFNNTSYPYRAMGQIGGGLDWGCSGTLVGRRHVLTAAHCLYNVSSAQWTISAPFYPGREGTCGTASCQPYGAHNGTWFFTPAAWRTTGDTRYDYGMMVLVGTPGNQTGWLGYAALSQGTLEDYCDKIPFGPGYLGGQCYNRGYPACGFVEAPMECRVNTNLQGWAYQDQAPCEIGSFYSTGADGWAARFNTNCDMSRGHSGSAVFTDVYNGSGKVVFGIASTQSCAVCGNNQSYVNGMRRVTPEVLDMISYFKAQMP
ncbi:MAG: trypsin-like serine protease [Xanthomonadales bacterium]|nr:trypsin-like serine protease [Xanthomonadales bacterium]